MISRHKRTTQYQNTTLAPAWGSLGFGGDEYGGYLGSDFVIKHNRKNSGNSLTMNDCVRMVETEDISSPSARSEWGATTASIGEEPPIVNQYGKKSITLKQFQSEYAGCLESEIIGGQSSKFGYTFPNKILGNGSFVLLNNGDEVDMTHFMVVGRRGEFMGVINEITQIGTSSFFYGQDLYSNKLGVNFFTRYDEVIKQNPIRISEYIYWFLSNPENTKH